MPTMIVVADSTRARFFTAASSTSPLKEIETLAHPEGRLHDRDVTSDLPGRGSGGNGSGKHTYETKTAPKKHELTVFAKRVADHLDASRTSNKMARVMLVAEPSFLGELRNQLSSATSEKVVFELDKNLAGLNPDEIRKHLPEYFKSELAAG